MKTSRFHFVFGTGVGPAAHPPWPDIHQEFAGETAPDGSWCAWRVTGANHRELGRSTLVYPDLEAVRDAAAMLQTSLDRAELEVHNAPPGSWGWRLRVDEALVATSSRGYLRRRECVYSMSTFIMAATVAEILDLRSHSGFSSGSSAESACLP